MTFSRDMARKATQATLGALRWGLSWLCALLQWQEGGKIPPPTDPLLLMSATQLAHDIRHGKLKSEQVIRAYIARIVSVDPILNATVERRFEKALEEAAAADAYAAANPPEQTERLKPLLGVPLTVKVFLQVEGMLCEGGCSLLVGERAEADSPAVALLRAAGAIVIATTNIPEISLALETENKLQGVTRNPHDTKRTPGGSSGGESALLGAAGSVIGLGNDLAGSIRTPCHFTGLFGLKPTAGSVPNGGCYPDISFLGDYACSGPMCRYAEDLLLTMRTLAPQLHFDTQVNFSKCTVLYCTGIEDLFASPVQPEIVDAIKQAAHYFERTHGCSVRELILPSSNDACRLVLHSLTERVNSVNDLGEALTAGRKKGGLKRELVKWILGGRSDLSRTSVLLLNFRKPPLLYSEALHPHYSALLRRLLTEDMAPLKDPYTFLLFPTFPRTAPYHGEFFTQIPDLVYAGIFNLLGFPAAQVPLGRTLKGDMPFGCQVVAGRGFDPLAVAVAVEMEKAFGGWTLTKHGKK